MIRAFIVSAVMFSLILIPTACSKSDSNGGTTTLDAIWIAPNGSDSNPGTISEPLKTIAKAKASAQTKDLDIYLVGGTYSETQSISLTNGASIYGGYSPVLSGGTRNRDLATYQSAIDFSGCADCSITVGESTSGKNSTIDGIEIAGSHVAISVRDSSPTITNCNISTAGGAELEYGIFLNPSAGKEASPTISNNTIATGNTLLSNGVTEGIVFYAFETNSKVAPVIENNTITAGRGGANSGGIVGYAQSGGQAYVTARGNTITAGTAGEESIGIWIGAGPEATSFNDATIEGNTIIAGNIEGAAEYTTSSGLMARGFVGTLTVVNNFIAGGDNSTYSSGIYMDFTVNAKIYCNTILAGLGTTNTWVVSSLRNVTTDAQNNIICASGGSDTDGIYEWEGETPTLKNNLFCSNLHVLYEKYVSGALVPITTIGAVNAADPTYSGNITGNAGFVDAANNNYHITAGSAAINGGLVLSSCPTDIDGTSRPTSGATDIGADEL